MSLTEPDLWISHIRLFSKSHVPVRVVRYEQYIRHLCSISEYGKDRMTTLQLTASHFE